MNDVNTALRPIEDSDMGFLLDLYASTRADEMDLVPWPDDHKRAFLRMQFDAQHAHYMTHFAGDRFDIILGESGPIGRLYVGRWPNEIRIIDIALMPEHRGKGLGSALMESLLAEAREASKPVRIHVESTNPALRLYERLGFRRIEDKGVYHLMEWSCQANTAS